MDDIELPDLTDLGLDDILSKRLVSSARPASSSAGRPSASSSSRPSASSSSRPSDRPTSSERPVSPSSSRPSSTRVAGRRPSASSSGRPSASSSTRPSASSSTRPSASSSTSIRSSATATTDADLQQMTSQFSQMKMSARRPTSRVNDLDLAVARIQPINPQANYQKRLEPVTLASGSVPRMVTVNQVDLRAIAPATDLPTTTGKVSQRMGRITAPTISSENIKEISLPVFSTEVIEKPLPVVKSQTTKGLATASTAEQRAVQNIGDIDVNRISGEKARKGDDNYSLEELRQIARSLDLNISGSKKSLAERIVKAINK